MRRCFALLLLLVTGCSSSATLPGDDADVDGDTEDSSMTMDAGMDSALPPPVCTGDTDPMNATFEIAQVDIPLKMGDPLGVGGFDIDGLDSEPDIPGCGWEDFPGGVDNAFVYTADTINNFAPLIDPDFDLYATMRSLIESGALSVTLELIHWNGMRDDDAVTVKVTLQSGNVMQESLGCGRMIDGTLEGTFDLPVSLALDFGDFAFALQLRSPRFRLALSQDTQTIDPARSYLGGYILWDDGTPTNQPGELLPQIQALIPSNIPPVIVMNALNAIAADIDGHPELMPCVAAPDTRYGVSADSISVGLRLSGGRAP